MLSVTTTIIIIITIRVLEVNLKLKEKLLPIIWVGLLEKTDQKDLLMPIFVGASSVV